MKFQFESIVDLFQMSGHGPYVWGSYIITFLVVGILIYIPYKLKREIVVQVKRQQKLKDSTR
ncbi:MAG: heme exporter protein D [Cellvibrionaceae bacterium]|jgi:heme exporter protein D